MGIQNGEKRSRRVGRRISTIIKKGNRSCIQKWIKLDLKQGYQLQSPKLWVFQALRDVSESTLSLTEMEPEMEKGPC